MIWESVKLALRAIRRNILRSVLTLLGIVIGVASVIALVTLGQGATDKVKADLTKLGSNMLIVRPGSGVPGPPSGNEPRTLSDRDIDALRSIPGVRAMAATANKTVKVTSGTDTLDVQVTGTEPGYFVAQDWSFSAGGPFSEADVRSGAALCVIGATVQRDLLRGEPAIGAVIRVAGVTCEVIGVMNAKGQSAFGSDQDLTVVMPLRAFHRRIAGNTRVSMAVIAAETPSDVRPVQLAITEVLRETRRIQPNQDDDFAVRDMTQMAQTLSSTTSIMTGLLSAVAAVSLLVGGIGIMNIMLVSVTERTREIGIRLAIGALGSQVMTQFLVEAVVLCLLGGMIGLALGAALAYAGSVALEVPFVINPGVALLSVLFSGVIGVVFGYFPARRAARLEPIDALRHE